MNLLCKFFGHKAARTAFGTPPYLDQRFIGRDAMGTNHIALFTRCARCGEDFEVGRIHLRERAA